MLMYLLMSLFVSQPIIGSAAPDFKGMDQNNKEVTLSTYKGKRVVLYFYPKDNTPGCTQEACNLRDNYQILQQKGWVIIGISTDDVKSHEAFSQKYNLPFSILADTDKKISNRYSVYDKDSGMNQRVTFLINEKGLIEHILKNPNTLTHAQEIITLWK